MRQAGVAKISVYNSIFLIEDVPVSTLSKNSINNNDPFGVVDIVCAS